MLERIDHAYAVMVAGRNVDHHDAVLNEVLDRAINFDKVKVQKQEVPYVGHIILSEDLKVDPDKVRVMRDMPTPTSKEKVRRCFGSV